jgi:hypothetical protein
VVTYNPSTQEDHEFQNSLSYISKTLRGGGERKTKGEEEGKEGSRGEDTKREEKGEEGRGREEEKRTFNENSVMCLLFLLFLSDIQQSFHFLILRSFHYLPHQETSPNFIFDLSSNICFYFILLSKKTF